MLYFNAEVKCPEARADRNLLSTFMLLTSYNVEPGSLQLPHKLLTTQALQAGANRKTNPRKGNAAGTDDMSSPVHLITVVIHQLRDNDAPLACLSHHHISLRGPTTAQTTPRPPTWLTSSQEASLGPALSCLRLQFSTPAPPSPSSSLRSAPLSRQPSGDETKNAQMSSNARPDPYSSPPLVLLHSLYHYLPASLLPMS